MSRILPALIKLYLSGALEQSLTVSTPMLRHLLCGGRPLAPVFKDFEAGIIWTVRVW